MTNVLLAVVPGIAVIGAILLGLVGITLVAFSLASRRRRGSNRLWSLGSVSAQWLLVHRSEDQ
jgi:hypothetical protein